MRWLPLALLVCLAEACSPIDTGVGSAAPVPDAGPVWSGGADAGSDAGTGSGADAGTADAGTATTNGCDGIVPPSTPVARETTVPHGSGEACWYAITDGQGDIAIEHHADDSGDDARWLLWSASGASSGALQATFDLHGEASGFTGVLRSDDQPWLARFSASGAELGRTSLGSKECSAGSFPAGGSVTLVLETCSGGALTLARYGADGKQTAARSVTDRPKVSATGLVDDRGNVLLVAFPAQELGRKTQYAARWYDASLAPLTDWFELPGSGDGPFVAKLAGGGAAVRIGGNWTAVIGSGASTYADAPAWLTARPRHDLQIVRQGRAYVLIPKFGAALPRNQLELYDLGGNRCGVGTFPSEGLSVGGDGTVIGSSGDGGCAIRFWPAVLR